MVVILSPVRAMAMLLAAGLLGCEVYSSASPAPCPGEPVARFSLYTPPDGGPVQAGSTCPFAGNSGEVLQSLGFTAEIRVDADGGAALCRAAPSVRQWFGTFQADRLDVSVTDVGGFTPSCSCALSVVERVTGDVQRDGGVPAAFSGELSDSVSPADPAELDGGSPDGGVCGCALPCQIRYAPLLGAATDGG